MAMHIPTVITSIVLSTAAATTVVVFGSSKSEPAPDPTAAAAQAEVAKLRDRVETMQAEFATAIAARSASPASVDRVAVPTLTKEQVKNAVEAYFAENGTDGAKAALAAAGGEGEPQSIEEFFASVNGTNFWDNSDAWRKAHEEGRMDELIDMFEEAAENDPGNIEAQMALASAYMAYMQLDNTKWQYSMKADQMYDRVLALDDHHWEARFTKAVSYTFYPKFLGKQGEAIQHFETLVQQQESAPIQDHQAQTYLYLGNLLEEKDPKKAREMWQRGMTRHPNNEELRKKLGQ